MNVFKTAFNLQANQWHCAFLKWCGLSLLSFFALGTSSLKAQWVEPDSILSISQLKQELVELTPTDSLGREVVITGIASVQSGLLHEIYLQTYIQNDSAGISIFAYQIDEPVSAGDSLVVRGTEQLYFGQPELLVIDYRVYPKKNALPEPIPLYKAFSQPNKYQGMLVQGEGIIKEKGNRFNGKYLMIAPSDTASTSVMIYVSNFHSRYQDFNFDQPSVGDRIEITGVLGQFDPANPDGTSYKVFLRTPDDFRYVNWPRYYFKVTGIVVVILAIVVIVWMILLKLEVRRKTRQLEQSLEDKNLLIMEIHHRVKNNLAAISGILELQSGTTDNEEIQEAFRESQTRIKSMAMVHEKLYQSVTLKEIPMRTYLEELSESVHRAFTQSTADVEIRVKADDTKLDTDTVIPLGLLVNEILVNAFKYAFNGSRDGIIRLELHEENGTVTLLVEDNGVGLPEDFDRASSDSLGMVLINVFSQQIGAKTSVKNTPGTCYIFEFPACR